MVKDVKIQIPTVMALLDAIKVAQLEKNVELAPFMIVNQGQPMCSMMGAPHSIKQVKVGWDGAMFKVVDSEVSAFYDDAQIQTALPIGRPGLIPMM